MTLLELLRQELPKRGGWPEGVTHICQDGDKYIGGYTSKPIKESARDWGNEGYVGGSGEYSEILADDYATAIVTREQYGATGWGGVGLPQIGVECEWQDKNTGGWQPVKVVYASEWVTVIREINEEKGDDLVEIAIENYGDDARLKFRPLRTEADKKRDAAIEAIDWYMPECILDTPNEFGHAKKIYDAIAAGKIPGVKLEV